MKNGNWITENEKWIMVLKNLFLLFIFFFLVHFPFLTFPKNVLLFKTSQQCQGHVATNNATQYIMVYMPHYTQLFYTIFMGFKH
jgi:hypothetical protein